MSISDLRTTLEYIKANPREWDQSLWICGTVACFAGHLALRDGWEPVEHEDLDGGFHVINGSELNTIDSVACSIAGILPSEGDVLWNGSNTLDQLEQLVRRLESDQAIYGTMSQPVGAWQQCWTNYYGTIMGAAHRRTSYVRIGGCVQRLDHDSRSEAVQHVLAATAGMGLDPWHNTGLDTLRAA